MNIENNLKLKVENMLQMYTDTQSSDAPLAHLSIISDEYISPDIKENFIPTKSIGIETSEYLPMTENIIDSATSIDSLNSYHPPKKCNKTKYVSDDDMNKSLILSSTYSYIWTLPIYPSGISIASKSNSA